MQRITIDPGWADHLLWQNQQNNLAAQQWLRDTPPAYLPTVAELVAYRDDPAAAMTQLSEALGLEPSIQVQSTIEQLFNASETTAPVQRRNLYLQVVPDNMQSAIDAGFESVLTGAGFLDMIKTARYPAWWGPIRGLRDVSHMLGVELDAFQRSTWLPSVTKNLAAANISAAMTWVREQRARGGEVIPF